MRLPYAVVPPSSLATQFTTGSSMVPNTVTLTTSPLPGPPSGEWAGMDPFLLDDPMYCGHGWTGASSPLPVDAGADRGANSEG